MEQTNEEKIIQRLDWIIEKLDLLLTRDKQAPIISQLKAIEAELKKRPLGQSSYR